VAKALLREYGIIIRAWTSGAAGVSVIGPEDPAFNLEEAEANALRVPHRETMENIMRVIEKLRAEGDSAGGTVSCLVTGIPPGLGEPVFGKLDARLAAAMLSLGAAKGIEFGAGFAAASGIGSTQNDCPLPDPEGKWAGNLPRDVPALGYKTNNAGGILGGISTGMPLEFKVAFKPVPSISKPQQTADRTGAIRELIIQGRHDICLVPRAVPVVEAMTALVLADLILLHRCDNIAPFFYG
jgi:chorismate synthase